MKDYGRLELETQMELDRLAELEDPICFIQPRGHGKHDPVILLEHIAEAARMFGEAVKHKAPIFVVTADCLAMHPELQEIASGLGGSIITSEEMPKPDAAFDNMVQALKNAQPKVQHFSNANLNVNGRTSKGDRRRKRQQWHRPKGTN